MDHSMVSINFHASLSLWSPLGLGHSAQPAQPLREPKRQRATKDNSDKNPSSAPERAPRSYQDTRASQRFNNPLVIFTRDQRASFIGKQISPQKKRLDAHAAEGCLQNGCTCLEGRDLRFSSAPRGRIL
jgi:hypothetical protein